MQDDLKERLQAMVPQSSVAPTEKWPPFRAIARIAALEAQLAASDHTVKALQQDALRYISEVAALEAKLAEKDALLRECGEAMNLCSYAMLEEWLPEHLAESFIATLAKIKDATQAGMAER